MVMLWQLGDSWQVCIKDIWLRSRQIGFSSDHGNGRQALDNNDDLMVLSWLSERKTKCDWTFIQFTKTLNDNKKLKRNVRKYNVIILRTKIKNVKTRRRPKSIKS